MATSPRRDPAADHRALTVGLVAMVTLVAFESLAVITILPAITDDLGGIAWYGWVTTAFFLGTMIGIVFAGEQADRHGAGRPYVVGLALFAAGLVTAGLAPAMPLLVVGRFVQGLGAGVVPAIGYVAIGRAYTVEQRARMFAILSTAWVVPGVVGPALAERVSSFAGWRWVFLGLLPLVVVAGLLIVPEMMRLTALGSSAPTNVRFWRRRLVEAARVAIGAALVVAGFNAVAMVAAAGDRRRRVDRPRSAAPADSARDAARRSWAAGRDPVARDAHVRLLRHRHLRAARADRRAWHLDVRRQRRRHRGDAVVDVGNVDPAALDHPHR